MSDLVPYEYVRCDICMDGTQRLRLEKKMVTKDERDFLEGEAKMRLECREPQVEDNNPNRFREESGLATCNSFDATSFITAWSVLNQGIF